MKLFIKLTLLTALIIALCSLFFEYIINRPVSVYIQYTSMVFLFIIVVAYAVYFVKQISNFLNSK